MNEQELTKSDIIGFGLKAGTGSISIETAVNIFKHFQSGDCVFTGTVNDDYNHYLVVRNTLFEEEIQLCVFHFRGMIRTA